MVDDGDARDRARVLKERFENGGGHVFGTVEPHLAGSRTVVILDYRASAFAEYLRQDGWRESVL
jgi:hypothetical protein